MLARMGRPKRYFSSDPNLKNTPRLLTARQVGSVHHLFADVVRLEQMAFPSAAIDGHDLPLRTSLAYTTALATTLPRAWERTQKLKQIRTILLPNHLISLLAV